MNIYVKYLGKPEIYLDNKIVDIQQKKIKMLFLYLLFNGSCTRDELASMFWCDYDESSAKSNLRNSLYKLKNIINENIILTKGNTYVQINQSIYIKKDVDIFITENNDESLLQLQDVVFLDKIFLKNCLEFENWVLSIRNIYDKMLIDKLQKGLNSSIKSNSTKLIEKYSIRIIEIDSYNEYAYKSLIKSYLMKGLFNEAIKLFVSLEKVLRKELGIEPEVEIKELYKKAVQMKQMKSGANKNSNLYYKHMTQVAVLKEEYKKYINNKDYSNCVLFGNIGMGKTKIINHFIEELGIKDHCIQIDAWIYDECTSYYIIERIINCFIKKYKLNIQKVICDENTNRQLVYIKHIERIINYLSKEGKKVVLVLNNLESFDDESFKIICSHFLNTFNNNIFIVVEYCQNFKADTNIILKLELLPNIKMLRIEQLNLNETYEYLNYSIKEQIDLNPVFELAYKDTQGNLMFLNDVANNIKNESIYSNNLSKNSIKNINGLFASLSKNENLFLEFLCIFENGIEINTFSEVLNIPVIDALSTFSKLYNRELIVDIKIENHLVVKIIYKIIRDYLYNRMANFKKMELHEIIARYYEQKYKGNIKDYFYLSELDYHFKYTYNQYDKLYYEMLHIEYRLDYSDEFFPTIKSNNIILNDFMFFNRSEVYKKFDEFKEQLNSIEDMLATEKLCELEMKINFLIGRTLNRDGRREEGIQYINTLVDMAQKVNNEDMLVKGYLETIYYGVKKADRNFMMKYIEQCKKLPNISKYKVEIGILYRIEALCNIIDKNYENAKILLLKSIEVFESPKLKSSNYINVAAAYDYLGLMYREQKKYYESAEYIKKSINICIDKHVKKSLDLFYNDLGYTYFLDNKIIESEECFRKSSEIYDMFGTYWLRSIVESCMSMISLNNGDKNKALEYFRRAEIFSKKDMTNEELNVLEGARELLMKYDVV